MSQELIQAAMRAKQSSLMAKQASMMAKQAGFKDRSQELYNQGLAGAQSMYAGAQDMYGRAAQGVQGAYQGASNMIGDGMARGRAAAAQALEMAQAARANTGAQVAATIPGIIPGVGEGLPGARSFAGTNMGKGLMGGAAALGLAGAGYAGYAGYNQFNKEASVNELYNETMVIKEAAEALALEAIEKLAYAEDLYQGAMSDAYEIEKFASDNGSGTPVPWNNGLQTLQQNMMNAPGQAKNMLMSTIQNGADAVNAGSVASAGAVTAFREEYRRQRALANAQRIQGMAQGQV